MATDTDELAAAVAAELRSAGLLTGLPGGDDAGTLLVVGAHPPALVPRVRALAAEGRVLVVLASPGAADPWELLDAGAADVVTWSAGSRASDLRARLERWATVDALVESEQVRRAAVGRSAVWRRTLREAVEIARFTTSSVLLTGETGTGKEVLARLVHELDPRSERGELVLVDCTTVVPSLSGSEFFGHEKGAFTGASTSRAGAFERADGGTLFLDEVGELPAAMQAELLRVVQEGVFKRVGGTRWQTTRFRLIAATNRDLLREQEEGGFRRDLYFRLAASTIELPPLRERVEDVVPLFRHFLGVAAGQPPPELEPSVAELLTRRRYPGNVRDLRQLAVRVASRHVGTGCISPGDVPPGDRPAPDDVVGPLPPRVIVPGQDRLPADAPGGQVGWPSPSAGGSSPQWSDQLERVVRDALRAGTGLKQLRALVGDVATRVALDEAAGPGEAARMLGVSRRAVEYRVANVSGRPPG